MPEVAILGGGLAGLSAGYHLKTSGLTNDFVIYEADATPGGLCRSLNIDGYIFDYGPHLLFGKDPYYVDVIQKMLGRNVTQQHSACAQYSFGHFVPFPYATNLHGMPRPVIQECLLGYIESQNQKRKVKPKTYRDWCYYHFGKGFAELFMFPYCRKIWTLPPEKLTCDWVGQRIVLPSIDAVLDGILGNVSCGKNYIKNYIYPKHGGMQALVDAMLQTIDPIRTRHRVSHIDPKRKTVEFANGAKTSYEHIITSIPLPDLIPLISSVPHYVKNAAEALAHNSLMILNCGVDRRNIGKKWQWIYFDNPKCPFTRVHFPYKFSPNNTPPYKSSLAIEMAYSRYRPLPRYYEKRSIEHLIHAGILNNSREILFIEKLRLKYAYVIFDHQRKTALQCIHQFLKKMNIISCGRFGEWGYLWTHQTMLSAKHAAEKIFSVQRQNIRKKRRVLS